MANTTGLPVLFATGNHAGRPAASAVGSGGLYSCTTHGLIYQSDGVSSWAIWATLGGPSATRASLGLDTTDSPEFAGLNVGAATDTTITRVSAGNIAVEGNALYRAGGTDVPVTDGGTGSSTASGARTNLGLVLGTDVASLTAGVVPIAQLATGTPDGTKFIRDDGTLQVPAGGGGGGLAQSFVGYNTIGGTWTTTTNQRYYLKQITLAADATFTSIDAHVRGVTDNIAGGVAVLLTDNAGAPDVLLAGGAIGGVTVTPLYFSNSASMPTAGRWWSIAIGAHVAAGTYWIGVMFTGTVPALANDGSGTDVTFTSSGGYVMGAYPSAFALTTGTVKYSIRASILS